MSKERAALIALVRWLGEQDPKPVLPLSLHAEVRRALGGDFYREVEKTCKRCGGSGDVLAGTTSERVCPECDGTGKVAA